ncbi:S8 family serine peptidase [Sphingomonas adhaesiva]|uniref:S8 family serine peptidase n=1 Tax=Sphingomonas adhaesiva TaxID=28212 RepID=UPI002FF65558
MITPSDKQPIRSVNDTPEFRRNYGANEFMNALYALDSGHTGQGVTVAVVDDGVMNVNGELDGRIDQTLSRDFGYVVAADGTRTKRNELGSTASDHGTAVANVIAARVNGNATVGYAPSATIAVLRVADWDEKTQGEILSHTDEAIRYAADKGIKIVSSSLVGGSPSWTAATERLATTGGLLVNSAGNFGTADPYNAQWINDNNRNAVLFVVALLPGLYSYQIESYSNRAGSMKERTVTAVGSNVTTMVDGTVGVFSGTSSASPSVAALAADILSKWPQLSGQQAGDVILKTAKDIGAPGPDEVFGMGLVDFQAALSPVNPTLSNGSTQTSIATSVMVVPTAVSTTGIQTALSHVTVLDAFGRDFTGSISALVVQPQVMADRRIERRVQQMGRQARLSFGGFSGTMGYTSVRIGPGQDQVRAAATAGTFGYTDGTTGVHAAWNGADMLQADVMGLAPFADGVLAYVPQAGTSLGVDRAVGGGRLGLTMAAGRAAGSAAQAMTLGWSRGDLSLRASFIDEDGTLMGMPTGSGALRLGRGARTVMVEVHHRIGVTDGWTLEGYGSLGVTRLKIDAASLVTGATPIIGSRIGVQATGAVPGGLLTLGIAQPLANEAGAAELTLGTGYNLATRSVMYGVTRASLAGQRRVQLTAGYVSRTAMPLRLGVMHDVTNGSVAALVGWQSGF